MEVLPILNLAMSRGRASTNQTFFAGELHGMASTLRMRTTISLGQWQPSAVLRPYWAHEHGLGTGEPQYQRPFAAKAGANVSLWAPAPPYTLVYYYNNYYLTIKFSLLSHCKDVHNSILSLGSEGLGDFRTTCSDDKTYILANTCHKKTKSIILSPKTPFEGMLQNDLIF